ncbi:MAG: hypothetical protein ABIF92_00130 [archaeon]
MVVIVITMTVMFIGTTGQTKITDDTVTQDLEAVHIAHMIENCFKQDQKYVSKLFVSNPALDICSACRICNPEAKAKVIDMVTAKEWDFGYTGDEDHKHSIFFIFDDGNTGRLYVGT